MESCEVPEVIRSDKPLFYEWTCKQLENLLTRTDDSIANLSNSAALLFQVMDRVSWAGFYIRRADSLVLGPFQGKPACAVIPFGKGVCGTALEKSRTIVVPDVRLFPGHIACDEASLSEIVVPVMKDGQVNAVLDIDSMETDRFTEEDARGLETFVKVLGKNIHWEEL
jgi:GAF domain-containing protein